MQCEFTGSCLFHQDLRGDDSAAASLMRLRYCKGGPETCARFVAAQRVGPEMVPEDLHPTEVAKVEVLQ